MIGNVGPTIDLERLIYSLCIDKKHFTLGFSNSGITCLINFIECRNLLYIWLCNHHAVVYSDFLKYKMIDHLMDTNVKSTLKRIRREDYFSCFAIAKLGVCDDDIWYAFKKEYIHNESEFSKYVLPQLLERRYLKPLWKSIFEYEDFMNSLSAPLKDKVHAFIKSKAMFGEIVTTLRNECGIKDGNLFIVKRSNKFYGESNTSGFYIQDRNNKKIFRGINKVIPIKEYERKFTSAAFYVFAQPEKIDDVKKKLPKVLLELL